MTSDDLIGTLTANTAALATNTTALKEANFQQTTVITYDGKPSGPSRPLACTPSRLSAWPHTPTPAGTVVELANPEDTGTYTVLSSFTTGQSDARPKTAYLLRDARGQVVAAINGWRVVDSWPSQRMEALREARDELRDLHEALRRANGEQ